MTTGGFNIGDTATIISRPGDDKELPALRLIGRTGYVSELDSGAEDGLCIGLAVEGWTGLVWCRAGEVEELIHLPRLDRHGNPTEYARCDTGDGSFPGGLLAVPNAWRANCGACLEWEERADS